MLVLTEGHRGLDPGAAGNGHDCVGGIVLLGDPRIAGLRRSGKGRGVRGQQGG